MPAEAPATNIVSGVPASGRLAFGVFRNGSPLGRHALTFRALEDRLEVEIEAEFALKLGFIPLFSYALRGREIWRAGRLESAKFRTHNNGAKARLDLQRGEEGLTVEGSARPPYRAPSGWLLATHWNRSQLDAPMISPQDGEVLRYIVTDAGPAPAPGGAPARRFHLAGAQPMDLWYDEGGAWVGLRARVWDGSTVEYRRSA